jgi:hypothetical protein
MINTFYYWCVDVMHFLANLTNTTYEEINIIVFVLGQPALIILFMWLWLKERNKNV